MGKEKTINYERFRKGILHAIEITELETGSGYSDETLDAANESVKRALWHILAALERSAEE